MELNNGFPQEEQRKMIQSDSKVMDHLPATKPPRSPRIHQGQHSPGNGSPVKHDRHSHSGRDGRPKKGGSGGKGTWGGLLDVDEVYPPDPNDPNYDSTEETKQLNRDKSTRSKEDYKEKNAVRPKE